jgi:hypothetical protein
MNNQPIYPDLIKKYEEKIKSIMVGLSDMSMENVDNINTIQKKVENEIIEFEKIIDEESMNRIVATHKINNILITKLREARYDFCQEKVQQNYEQIINNAANALNNLNNSFP